jgi:hypothetical protein
MPDFSIKQSDVLPVLNDTLTYSDGTAANLTGASVTFVMRALTANNPTVKAAATIVSPPAGTVSYTFTAADTAVAGQYVANWIVTFSGGNVQTWPTVGAIEITVEENLTTAGGARLVGLGEVKDYLNLAANDRSRDAKLLRYIDDIAPTVEFLTGPILQRLYQNETYDGGGWFVSLRHRPIIEVHSVVEYRGPIPYNLTQVPTPDLGTIYSYMFQPPGRVVRRTVGGGVTSFPPGPDQVWVTYTSGYAQVPRNVTMGTLELIRVNFQETQEGRPGTAGGGMVDDDDLTGHTILGFFVPNRVRELLGPNKRHPSVA